MQRNFKPMADQIRYWRASQLTDGQAKEILYRPFIEDELDAPKHLACAIHHEYFEPDFRNLRRGPSGACKAPSPAASGSSNPFLNSRQQPALASTTIHWTRRAREASQPTSPQTMIDRRHIRTSDYSTPSHEEECRLATPFGNLPVHRIKIDRSPIDPHLRLAVS